MRFLRYELELGLRAVYPKGHLLEDFYNHISLYVDCGSSTSYTPEMHLFAMSTQKLPLCGHKHLSENNQESVSTAWCLSPVNIGILEHFLFLKKVKVSMQFSSQYLPLLLQLVTTRIVTGGNIQDFSASKVELSPKVSWGERDEGKCTLEMLQNNSAAFWACR